MFPQIFGKYMLEREIASGGMARVYLATLRGAGGFEKRLVVKQIRPELASDHGFVERFVKEAKTAVELTHPNIVPVYELGVEQGVYYIAMELCDGATLSELLAGTGPLDPEEGAYLGVEVCRALDYAHRRAQVIHRDVTPRNVLIDEEGAVRLIDFGIAAPAADGEREERTDVFGSPGHMPPEQLAGKALTPAADVFAVGVLLYEALTGRPAFRRATAKESRAALYEELPELDDGTPALRPLSQIVHHAMRLEQDERPASAEALARPMREYLRAADLGDVARRLGERVRTQRRRSMGSSPWLVGEGLTGLQREESSQSSGSLAAGSQETPALRTRTFATNPTFTQLTRPEEGAPKGSTGGALGTRRLPSSRPPPALSGDPNRTPSDEPGPEPVSSAISPNKPGVRRVRGLLMGLAIGVPASVVATAAWFTAEAGAPEGSHPEASVRPVRPSAAPVAVRPTPLVSASEPTPAPPVASAKLRGEPVNAAPATSHPKTHEPELVPEAALSLTALPGTRVSVAGREFATPVTDLKLPAGRYRITFHNATWDGPVSAQVVLLPGRASRVHADFTNEPPQVVVR